MPIALGIAVFSRRGLLNGKVEDILRARRRLIRIANDLLEGDMDACIQPGWAKENMLSESRRRRKLFSSVCWLRQTRRNNPVWPC
jgi:hypothetical protein